MRPINPKVLLLCWLALLLVLPSAARAAGEDWIKLRSENFVVYTGSSEGKARRVLEHLERVRKAYTYMLNAELDGEEPVYVVLFNNQREFLKYSVTETSQGYYTQARGRDYIVMSDFNENAERLMNHEYFHLYSRHQKFQWPTWGHEGFADYFSTLRITGKRIEVGHPIENHMRYLINTGRSLSTDRLFAMSSEERHVAERREVTDLYAMSWALVHLIFSAPEQQENVGAMLAALQRTENSAEAFEQIYDWSLKDIDDQLNGYVRRAVMGFRRMDVPGLDFDAPTEPVELEEWEAPLILADLLAFSRHTEEADEEYSRLSALYPAAPDVDDSLAQLRLRNGQRAAAIPLLRSAVAKGSRSPETYAFLVYEDCQSGEVTDQCVELSQKAADLAPDDTNIQIFNMSLAVRAQRFVPALLMANKVGKITPKDAPRFFYYVAYAQYRVGQLDDARNSLERALEHAESLTDRQRLYQLRESIERGPERMVRMREAPVASSLPAEGEDFALTRGETLTPEEFQEREERFAERAPVQPSVASVAQRLVNALTIKGVTLANGQLREMDCSTVPPALKVEADGALLPLLIDDPTLISIIRDGRIINDYQFTCGPQSGEALRVGYEANADGSFLRLLQFGDIE